MENTDHKLLRGNDIARPIRVSIKERVNTLVEAGWTPRLASIHIGSVDAADVYIRNQARVAKRMGIEFVDRKFPENVTHLEVMAAINSLNADPRVTGIILQRPVPAHIDLHDLQDSISPLKDVEGMHPANIGRVVYGDFIIGPCTAIASVEILKSTGLKLEGLDVVVVGHSEIVGKPIALHLLAELATVTVCHHATQDLGYHTRQADAVFVAVGKPGLITGDMIKPGAAVIDIGINLIDVEDEDGIVTQKLVGDADLESVAAVAGWFTPVPGGVGPMTLTILMRNVVAALEEQRRRYEAEMRANT